MSPRISVILPVYNTRKYLPFTLHNIIIDQFSSMCSEDWELIVVDDGSTDGSHTEVEPWIERYPNSIKLIRTKNAGVSAARNTGLAAARGHYVYFMDSDDIIKRNALTRLLETAEKEHAEVMRFEFSWLAPENYPDQALSVPDSPAELNYHICSGNDFLTSTLGMVEYPAYWNVWTALFLRDFLISHNFRFIPGLHIGEDYIFMWQVLQKAQIVSVVNAQLYLYNFRQGNASNPTTPQALTRKINALKLLMDYQDAYFTEHSEELPARASQGFLLQLRYHSEHLLDCFKQQHNKLGIFYTKLRRSRIKRNYISIKQSNNKVKAALYIYFEQLIAAFLFNQ